MSKDKPPRNPAMYLAFKKACEDKKENILNNADYKIAVEVEHVINRIQKAPFPGRIPVEKIQAAVDSVSKKDES
jgi:Txe/YoeB family toxin of Txe-Axe toxin-antitoxin module